MYTQNESTIGGRHVWHYLVDTPIGNIHIIQHEGVGLEIETDAMIMNDLDKAEKKYKSVVKKLVNEM